MNVAIWLSILFLFSVISASIGYVYAQRNPSSTLETKITLVASIAQSVSVVFAILIFGYQYFKDSSQNVSDQMKYSFELVKIYNTDRVAASSSLLSKYMSQYAIFADGAREQVKQNPQELIKLESEIFEKVLAFNDYVYDANICISSGICDKEYTTARVCNQIGVAVVVQSAMKWNSELLNTPRINGINFRDAAIKAALGNFDAFKSKYHCPT